MDEYGTSQRQMLQRLFNGLYRSPRRPVGRANALATRAHQRVTVNWKANDLLASPHRFPSATDATLKQQLHALASSSHVNGGCRGIAFIPHTPTLVYSRTNNPVPLCRPCSS